MARFSSFSRILGLGFLAVIASTACVPLDDLMATVFGRSMRDQRSFDPHENPQLPPEGSVPFSAGNFPPAPGQVNIGQPDPTAEIPAPFPAGETGNTDSPILNALVNPVPADAASLERGQVMYDRFCAVCHGEPGIGAEAYIVDKHPYLLGFDLSGEKVAGFSDGYIYGMIRVGRALMPEYGSRISNYDRWHIVNYMRELQRQAGTFPVDGGGVGGN